MIEYQAQSKIMPDTKETPSISRAVWLSGIFETGGSMGFAIETWPARPDYESVYGYITRNDSYRRTMDLIDLFGGRKQLQKRDSWRWELKGPRAIEIALEMESFSPSRKNIIGVFKELEKEDSMKRKVELVREFRKSVSRKDIVCEEEYFRLLQNPVFTAGVFDAIGTVDSTPLRVQFESTNQPLIDAMKDRFGGSITLRVKPGTQVMFREASWVTVNPSHELTLASEKSRDLLHSIVPHLQMTRERVLQILDNLE